MVASVYHNTNFEICKTSTNLEIWLIDVTCFESIPNVIE